MDIVLVIAVVKEQLFLVVCVKEEALMLVSTAKDKDAECVQIQVWKNVFTVMGVDSIICKER